MNVNTTVELKISRKGVAWLARTFAESMDLHYSEFTSSVSIAPFGVLRVNRRLFFYQLDIRCPCSGYFTFYWWQSASLTLHSGSLFMTCLQYAVLPLPHTKKREFMYLHVFVFVFQVVSVVKLVFKMWFFYFFLHPKPQLTLMMTVPQGVWVRALKKKKKSHDALDDSGRTEQLANSDPVLVICPWQSDSANEFISIFQFVCIRPAPTPPPPPSKYNSHQYFWLKMQHYENKP